MAGTGVDGGTPTGKETGGGSGAPPSSDGSPPSSSSSGSGSGSGSGSPGTVTCRQTAGSGSSGGGSCGVGLSESCTDGTVYSAKCSCPDATCECNAASPQGGSSGSNVAFDGCPDNCGPTSVQLAYQACGFPPPQ